MSPQSFLCDVLNLIRYTTLYITYPSAVKEVRELITDGLRRKGKAKMSPSKSSSFLHADLSRKSRDTNQTGEIDRRTRKKRLHEESDGLLNRAGPDYYRVTLILTKVSVKWLFQSFKFISHSFSNHFFFRFLAVRYSEQSWFLLSYSQLNLNFNLIILFDHIIAAFISLHASLFCFI